HLDNSSLCATYCLILSSPSTAPTDIFTLSLHDALPISLVAYFAGADEVVEAEPEFLEALAKAGGVVISPSLRCHVPSLRSFHDFRGMLVRSGQKERVVPFQSVVARHDVGQRGGVHVPDV